MIIVYYNLLPSFISEKDWNYYFQLLPVEIQERISRYKKLENKYQLLIGRLLLKKGMEDFGYLDFNLKAIFYNEYQKPQWKNEIDFNIAHSGNLVACAFSKKNKVGLDVEVIKTVDFSDFHHIFNERDWAYLHSSQTPNITFFKIWTIKEAITKAIGKGLAIDVQKIEIFDGFALLEGEKWFYKELDFKAHYSVFLVSDSIVTFEVVIREINFFT